MNSGILLPLAALCLLTACSGTKEDTKMQVENTTAAGDTLSHQDLYHQAAVELVGRFSRDLRTELLAAIKDSGSAAGALRVCRTKAPELVLAHSIGGWRIRRVTDRPRNPADLISIEQSDILAKFADAEQAPPFVEEWLGTDNMRTYRFYTPIRTATFCLNCHGDENSLAPGVAAALDTLYPDDKAVGYTDDQLRGMFVVEAGYPQGLDGARTLVAARDTL